MLDELLDRQLAGVRQITAAQLILGGAQLLLGLGLRLAVDGLPPAFAIGVIAGAGARDPKAVGALEDGAFISAPSSTTHVFPFEI